jgi:ribosomal protein S18 acetylase RimI-like enzyme
LTLDTLTISPLLEDDEAEACAAIMALSEPWLTLKRDYEASLRFLQDSNKERYVAHFGDRLAGFIILNMKGAFVGYIQTVCVDPDFRGAGVGSSLIAFAEQRIFNEYPNVFMCVSSFNQSARRLYQRLGYTTVGELTDYVVSGHSEFLLRKSKGPLFT